MLNFRRTNEFSHQNKVVKTGHLGQKGHFMLFTAILVPFFTNPLYYSRRFFKCKKPVGRSENLRNSEQLYHLLVQPLQTPPRIIDTELVVHKNSILTKNCIIELSQAVDENDVNFCVSWNRRGDKVYVGNGKGRIFVFRWEEIIQMKSSKTVESIWDFKIFSTFKITSPASVRLIEFSKKGSKFVVVTDKVIRMYQEDLIKDNKPDSPNAKSNKQSNRISSKEYSGGALIGEKK